MWLATKATSNSHIIKSSAGATIIHTYILEPQQAALTIVAALGLSLGLAHGISRPSLEHLRFLPTQFTLITDFRQRDNISDAPQRNPLPRHTHTDTYMYIASYWNRSGSIDNASDSARCSSAADSHSPCEFILSLALFVCKCHVNFIKIL